MFMISSTNTTGFVSLKSNETAVSAAVCRVKVCTTFIVIVTLYKVVFVGVIGLFSS